MRRLLPIAAAAVTLWTAAGCGGRATFSALVDDYLDQFALRHPSIAAGNGLHAHDDRLEDFSPASIREEIAWLRSVKGALDALDPSPLSADGRVDRRILQGIVDGWLLDLDTLRSWARNPMIYATAVSDGVHNLMRMESSPAESRMRQAAAKLRLVPRLLASARENIQKPPRVLVERAIVMFRGTADLLARDLPAAFAHAGDAALQTALSSAAPPTPGGKSTRTSQSSRRSFCRGRLKHSPQGPHTSRRDTVRRN